MDDDEIDDEIFDWLTNVYEPKPSLEKYEVEITSANGQLTDIKITRKIQSEEEEN